MLKRPRRQNRPVIYLKIKKKPKIASRVLNSGDIMKDLISNKFQDRYMAIKQIFEIDNEHKRLVKEFGSKYTKNLKQIPDLYTFKKGLIFS